MKHRKSAPLTDLDKARFEKLYALGCICCRIQNDFMMPAEIHHLLSGNKRRGHEFTIPLCRWHHQGRTFLSHEQALETWGPSLAKGSKPFHERYGTDDELLERVNLLMGII